MNVRLLLILPAALAALLAPVATADAAKKRKSVFPKIAKITPLNLAIGDTMTINGRNFLRGKNRNTVVFKRGGQRAIFAKAATASRRKLSVVVPEKLRGFLTEEGEQAVPTKFRIRILAKRFGRRYTKTRVSPTIAPMGRITDGGPAPDAAAAPPAPTDCDNDGILDDVDTDDDNDHMSDAFEVSIGTDPCKWDTDGDTLSDYWEYESALDLNLRALPYPGKRPYPNALDPDLNTDYDGDGMVAWQEHAMWTRYGNMGTYLNYSDGAQVSEPGSGTTDDRRDVDGDGLMNWWEANGPMRRDWWKDIYTDEILYPVVYADPDFLDPDSDGDGRLDGADDIDHDGYSNRDEMARGYSSPAVKLADKFDATAEAEYRWVQPHNPCLPDPESITCSLHPPPLDKSWPPFKQLVTHHIPINDDFPRPLPLTLSPKDPDPFAVEEIEAP